MSVIRITVVAVAAVLQKLIVITKKARRTPVLVSLDIGVPMADGRVRRGARVVPTLMKPKAQLRLGIVTVLVNLITKETLIAVVPILKSVIVATVAVILIPLVMKELADHLFADVVIRVIMVTVVMAMAMAAAQVTARMILTYDVIRKSHAVMGKG